MCNDHALSIIDNCENLVTWLQQTKVQENLVGSPGTSRGECKDVAAAYDAAGDGVLDSSAL